MAPGRPRAQRLIALECCRRLLALPACREPVEAVLWTLLSDPDASVRDRARALFKRAWVEYPLPPWRDVNRILATLSLDDEEIQSRARSFLDTGMYPALVAPLADRNHPSHAGAARALIRLLELAEPPDDVSPRLLRAAEGSELAELATARPALRRIVREQGPPSADTIKHIDTHLALVAVDSRHSTDAYRDLTTPSYQVHAARVLEDRLLADKLDIRSAAAWALRVIYAEGRVPSPKALANLSTCLRSENRTLALEAAATLRTGLKPSVSVPLAVMDALGEALARDDTRLRRTCVSALAACGLQAERTLIPLLQDRDRAIQTWAIHAVIEMVTTHRVVPRSTEHYLERLADSGASAEVRGPAQTALNLFKTTAPGDWP
jgi:hypothetical protein